MEKLKVGFIGCGRHATKVLYPSLHYAPIHLECVCDLDEKLAQRNANWFGASRYYTDYQKMLTEIDLDAVIIVTGPKTHPILAAEALELKLDVFIEKPPGLHLNDANKLAQACKESRKSVTVGLNKRWALAYQKIKTLLASMDNEHLSHIQATFRVGAKNCTGYTLLLDAGIHILDLVRFLVGEVESVKFEKWHTEHGAAYAIALLFERGTIGNVHISDQGAWEYNNDFIEITNAGHVIRSDNLIRVLHMHPDGKSEIWEPGFSIPVNHNNSLFIQGYAPQLQAWAQALLNRKEPSPAIEDTCRTMRLISEIEPSEEYGKAPQRFAHWHAENQWLISE